MPVTNYTGIDYSGVGGKYNRDVKTGCRYGIIPVHDLDQLIWETAEPEYASGCPVCGGELTEVSEIEDDIEYGEQ